MLVPVSINSHHCAYQGPLPSKIPANNIGLQNWTTYLCKLADLFFIFLIFCDAYIVWNSSWSTRSRNWKQTILTICSTSTTDIFWVSTLLLAACSTSIQTPTPFFFIPLTQKHTHYISPSPLTHQSIQDQKWRNAYEITLLPVRYADFFQTFSIVFFFQKL